MHKERGWGLGARDQQEPLTGVFLDVLREEKRPEGIRI